MKTIFSTKILGGAALVALAVVFGHSALQSATPAAQPESVQTTQPVAATPIIQPAQKIPPNILPSSPLAQVIKLAQAGLDEGILMAYVTNSSGTFNLDSEKIIYATDAGVPNGVVTAMMQRDQNLQQIANTPPPQPQQTETASAPAPATTYGPDVAITTGSQPVTVNYFYSTLTPYGAWIEIPGYGRCWRPNVVVYDAGWQPYCDRGYWTYTDCGWYWVSDYSWGYTFHYGRWFRDAHYGWCWWPDTVWSPSWVTWRYTDDYCGWSPLPPFTTWQPGVGFCYHGNGVSVGFDFGLAPSCFVFVSTVNFCNPHLRVCAIPPAHVTQIFNHTTVINNININVNRTVVNNGIAAQYIAAATHRQITPTPVHELRTQLAQRASTQRDNYQTRQNENRTAVEANANERIQNVSDRQQQQRERLAEARQNYGGGNGDSISQNDNSMSQRRNTSRPQESEQAYQARQNQTRQNVDSQNQAAMNAQREALQAQSTANVQREAAAQARQNEIRQAQSRQESVAQAQAHVQQQQQAQAQSAREQAQSAHEQAQDKSDKQDKNQRGR